MILDLNELPEEGLELRRDVELDAPEGGEDRCRLVAPARLEARARAAERGVALEGRIEAAMRLDCSRCLEPCPSTVVAEFHLIVVFEGAEYGAADQRLNPEDADLVYAAGGRLDLRDLVREQVVLNLPAKPVCRADCAGLCPTCGGNRNHIECRCRAVEVDPRLSGLAAWKERLRERGPRGSSGEDDDAESKT